MEDKKLISANERQLMYIDSDRWGAEDTFIEILQKISEYLSLISSKDAVNQALINILFYRNDGENKFSNDIPWIDLLYGSSGEYFTESKIGGALFEVGAYAEYGIVMDHCPATVDERYNYLQNAIEQAERFYKLSPLELWGVKPNNDLQQLVLKASNRWELDNDRPIEPAALALFGGVSEGRIRNMTSGQNKTFSLVDGRIPAQEALAWLSTREEFWNSIWRDNSLPEYGVNREAPIKEAVFLPVARDGSVFHPGLYRGENFTIGPKGSEVQVEYFDDALKALQQMPTPYWRRPNDKGNWGIVVGIDWARFDASELDAIAKTPGYRVPNSRNA